MKKLLFGIVGCGQISDRYFEMVKRINNVEIAATCSLNIQNAKQKAEEYGIANYFDNYKKMMEEVILDAVIVATPNSVHAEVCFAAFEHNLHVLNEKPMATSFNDCLNLVKTAEDKKVVFMSMPYDMISPVLTAQHLLKEEFIGNITGAESCLNFSGPPRNNWYYDINVAQGGAMLDCMVYPVSRLISILGQVSRVTGLVNNLIPKRIVENTRVNSTVDDNITLLAEFEHGQQAVFRSLWATSFYENSTYIYGRKGTIILTTEGRTLLQTRNSNLNIPDSEPTKWKEWDGCVEVKGIPETENIVDHFVKCIRENKEPISSGRRQLHIHEILFKGYESSRLGKTLDLETTYKPWHKLDISMFDTSSFFI